MRTLVRSFVAVLALALLSSAAIAGDDVRIGEREAKPRTPRTIRIATYNCLNLFDDKDDPALTDRNDDMLSVKPAEECEALAQTIRRVDADVLAVEEIESLEALLEFRDKYLKDMGYKHVVSIDVGQERGIENAVLSRFPLKDEKVWPNLPLGGVHPEKYGDKKNWYAGQPITFRRSPLRVTVEVPSDVTGAEPYDLTMFVVHHKSGQFNRYWRIAEAEKIVEFLKEMQAAEPDRNIVVLGDFNAQPFEYSVQVYRREAGLKDVLGDRKKDDPASMTHATNRTIDMILVNDALDAEIVDDSAFILGTPQRPDGADWRTTPEPEGFASDHLPVAVDIVPRDKSN